MTPGKQEAARRIRQALDQIQQAQILLDEAARSICSVRGTGPEWTRIGRLYDRVKESWHKLERKLNSGRFDLD